MVGKGEKRPRPNFFGANSFQCCCYLKNLYLNTNENVHKDRNTNTNTNTNIFSTCGSLMLLYSAASDLSSSHHILNNQFTSCNSIPKLHNLLTLAHMITSLVTFQFTFPVSSSFNDGGTRLAGAAHVRTVARPTGNCLIWLKQPSTGASALHIYSHTYVYTKTH